MPPLLAASASAPSEPLVLLALVLAGGYLAACAIWPFTSCARCDGRGKFRSPSGRAWRGCRRCKGSGARLRYGRRVWNYLHRTHQRGDY